MTLPYGLWIREKGCRRRRPLQYRPSNRAAHPMVLDDRPGNRLVTVRGHWPPNRAAHPMVVDNRPGSRHELSAGTARPPNGVG